MNPTDETLIQLQNTLANEHDPVKVIDLLFDLGTKLRKSLEEFSRNPVSDPPDNGRQVKVILRDGRQSRAYYATYGWILVTPGEWGEEFGEQVNREDVLGWRDLV